MDIDLSLLVLRVLVGLLLLGHGMMKVSRWFGGYGFKGTIGWLASLGLRPAPLWALAAALGELGGGLLLVLGLLNPLGPLAIVGAMAMAIALVHWPQGLWVTNNGYEYPLVLLVLSAGIGLSGPGRYSLDALLGLALPTPLLFGTGLLGVAIVVGTGLAQTQSARHAAPGSQQTS